MTQVRFNTDKLLECVCGYKPEYYTVGYGRTPYDVFCPICLKQTSFSKCKVTGSPSNLIDYWNTHIRHLTREEVENEVKEFSTIQKKNIGFDMYSRYDVYWESGKGESLSLKPY